MASTSRATPVNGYGAYHYGVKRSADDDLANEQRLSKRFNLLNLDSNRLYIPVTTTSDVSTTTGSELPPTNGTGTEKSLFQTDQDDYMLVEDSPHKTYIHNLDAELASIDAEDAQRKELIFIPDIERHLNRIPKHVLTGDPHPAAVAANAGNELVLYSVPSSLSVPQEQDSVRKAIIESRARARERQALDLQGQKQKQREALEPWVDSKTGIVTWPREDASMDTDDADEMEIE